MYKITKTTFDDYENKVTHGYTNHMYTYTWKENYKVYYFFVTKLWSRHQDQSFLKQTSSVATGQQISKVQPNIEFTSTFDM